MRKKKHEEEEKLERWLVSYADFITLLFAFFTVMYALSQADKAKYKQAAEAIQKAFLTGGGIFPLKGSPFSPFEKAPDKGSIVPPNLEDEGQHSKSNGGNSEAAQAHVEGIFRQTTGLGLSPDAVHVFRTDQGYKIRLNETILFNPQSDKLKKSHLPFIFEIGKRLARLGTKVEIEAHSDNQEMKDGLSNWQLSLNRATTLLQFLVQATNFPKDQIALAALGDTRPLASNVTQEGRAQNRRVEIHILTSNPSLLEQDW